MNAPETASAQGKFKIDTTAAPRRKRKNKQPEGYIPRPPNPFVLFRNNLTHDLKAAGKHQTDVSKIAAKLWDEAKDNGTAHKYYVLAEEAKQKHAEKYPDYKFQPQRKRKGSEKKGKEKVGSAQCSPDPGDVQQSETKAEKLGNVQCSPDAGTVQPGLSSASGSQIDSPSLSLSPSPPGSAPAVGGTIHLQVGPWSHATCYSGGANHPQAGSSSCATDCATEYPGGVHFVQTYPTYFERFPALCTQSLSATASISDSSSSRASTSNYSFISSIPMSYYSAVPVAESSCRTPAAGVNGSSTAETSLSLTRPSDRALATDPGDVGTSLSGTSDDTFVHLDDQVNGTTDVVPFQGSGDGHVSNEMFDETNFAIAEVPDASSSSEFEVDHPEAVERSSEEGIDSTVDVSLDHTTPTKPKELDQRVETAIAIPHGSSGGGFESSVQGADLPTIQPASEAQAARPLFGGNFDFVFDPELVGKTQIHEGSSTEIQHIEDDSLLTSCSRLSSSESSTYDQSLPNHETPCSKMNKSHLGEDFNPISEKDGGGHTPDDPYDFSSGYSQYLAVDASSPVSEVSDCLAEVLFFPPELERCYMTYATSCGMNDTPYSRADIKYTEHVINRVQKAYPSNIIDGTEDYDLNFHFKSGDELLDGYGQQFAEF
ncbi:hypothetical protein L218DRAFT_943845 [Marasmius fiardii PR-910]|nr:hypothetical protein L218DRAFT_943845 [Marasmius fiardii PR-910]